MTAVLFPDLSRQGTLHRLITTSKQGALWIYYINNSDLSVSPNFLPVICSLRCLTLITVLTVNEIVLMDPRLHPAPLLWDLHLCNRQVHWSKKKRTLRAAMVGQDKEELMFMRTQLEITAPQSASEIKPIFLLQQEIFSPKTTKATIRKEVHLPILTSVSFISCLSHEPSHSAFATIWFNISLQKLCVKETHFKFPLFSCPFSDVCSFTMSVFH